MYVVDVFGGRTHVIVHMWGSEDNSHVSPCLGQGPFVARGCGS